VGYGVMAYDASLQQVLLCTDNLASPTPQPGPPTFAWTGSSWKQIIRHWSTRGISCIQHVLRWEATHLIFAGANANLDVARIQVGTMARHGSPPCLGTALAGDIKRQRSILFGASSFWASATSSAIARDLGVATLSKRSGWATRLARPAARKIRQRPVRL
jgi:hypothetical protein